MERPVTHATCDAQQVRHHQVRSKRVQPQQSRLSLASEEASRRHRHSQQNRVTPLTRSTQEINGHICPYIPSSCSTHGAEWVQNHSKNRRSNENKKEREHAPEHANLIHNMIPISRRLEFLGQQPMEFLSHRDNPSSHRLDILLPLPK